jgi:hypothetical protein
MELLSLRTHPTEVTNAGTYVLRSIESNV